MAVNIEVDEPEIDIRVRTYDGYVEATGASAPLAVGDAQIVKGALVDAGPTRTALVVGDAQTAKGAAVEGSTSTALVTGDATTQKGDGVAADGTDVQVAVGSAETTEGKSTQADGAEAPLVAGNAQTEHLKPDHRWQMPLPRNLLDDPESFDPDTTAWQEFDLADPIQAEKDRAQAGGAIIEDGVYFNLIDPLYDVLDGAGVWSNVVGFYVAGVRDVVSGSVSKLYDQSGGQNDATQGTSSKRPTDSTLNSRAAASFDGSDDFLKGTIPPRTAELTVLSVFDPISFASTQIYTRQFTASENYNNLEYVGSNANGVIGASHRNGNTNRKAKGSVTQTSSIKSYRYNENNDVIELFDNGTSIDANSGLASLDKTSSPDLVFGTDLAAGNFAEMDFQFYIAIQSDIGSSLRSDLRDVIRPYFNL